MAFFRSLERRVRHTFRPKLDEGQDPRAALQDLARQMAALQNLAAEPMVQRVRQLPPGTPLQDCEFKVHSQFGEDGILQHLVAHVPMAERSFVEFGVEDFTEANCRFLLERDPWRGLIMDGDPALGAKVGRRAIHMLRHLTAKSAFVTAENINELLREAGFTGDLGILSIDIDGNDYWVWKAIDVVSPRIVVVEYNAVFGSRRALTVPYDPAFTRQSAHPSWLYWGASLPAFCRLAAEKGYALVGTNSVGINAFFVRKDVLGGLKELTPEEGYTPSCVRDSRGPGGQASFLGGQDRFKAIAAMPVMDLDLGRVLPLGETAD